MFNWLTFVLRLIINHLKVWHIEQEIRLRNELPNPNAELLKTLVNKSRDANNNRISYRDRLSKKLAGILNGVEGVGSLEPKFFKAEGRK